MRIATCALLLLLLLLSWPSGSPARAQSTTSSADAQAPADSVVAALRAADYERAIRWGERRRELQEADPATRPIDLATTLTYLGLAHRNLDRFDRAETLARRVLGLMIEAYGEASPNAATALNNLAGVLKERGDGVGAEAAYRASLAQRLATLPPGDTAIAASWNNLGTLLLEQGDAAGAREELQRAVPAAEAAYGASHPTTLRARRNLAQALFQLEEFDAAEAELEAVAAAFEASGEATLPDRADLLFQRARVWAAWGRVPQAESALRESIELRSAAYAGPQLETVRARNELSRLLVLQGRMDEAARLGQQCVEESLELVGEAHALTVDSWVARADVQMLEGNVDAAVGSLEAARRAHSLARRRTASGWKRATVRLADPSPRLAAALLLSGRPHRAWEVLERSRAQLLRELLDRTGHDRLDPELLRRETELRSELAVLRSRVDLLRREGAPPELAAEETRLAARESDWAQLQARIEAESGGPAVATEGALLAEVAARLRPDEALVGWLDVDAPSWPIAHRVWVLRSGGRLHWAEQGSPGHEASFHDAIVEASTRAFARPEPRHIRPHLVGLYAARIEPIETWLEGVAHLVVVPSGAMHGIPVDALVDREGRSLLDRFEVEVVPSASLLTGSAPTAESPSLPRDTVLALGDPPFGAGLPRLPASREEASEIRGLFPEGTLLLGNEASETRLHELARDDALRRFDVLHLATHAYPDGRRPQRSHLVLAGAGEPRAPAALATTGFVDDGRLSVGEILAEWNLDASLVTLSACATAEGRLAGGEGVLGFAHSFFEVGARHLLMSEWEVDDVAARRLMGEFYRRWKEDGARSPHAALREAKRALRDFRDERGERPFAHPCDWAAFQLWSAR